MNVLTGIFFAFNHDKFVLRVVNLESVETAKKVQTRDMMERLNCKLIRLHFWNDAF